MPRIQLEPNWKVGEWCVCPVRGWEGWRVKIRHLSPGIAGDHVKDSTKEKKNRLLPKFNSEHKDRLDYDWVIETWEDLQDTDGNEIPCTLNNKMKVVENHQSVCDWIDKMATDEDEGVYAIKRKAMEDEVKNSESGPQSTKPIEDSAAKSAE